MKKLFLVIFALVLGACAVPGNKQDEQPSKDDNAMEESPIENEETNQPDHSSHDSETEEEQSIEEVYNEIEAKITANFEVKLPAMIEVSNDQYLSAVVDSDALSYEVTYYETNDEVDVNDARLTTQHPLMVVKGTVYDSQEEANEQVGYQPIQKGMPEVDLGHGIIGYRDAGAGSVFTTWHEGRWSFIMRARNEEAEIAAGEQLAKDIVEKLEEKTLPPPHENGAGILSSGNHEDVETNRLAWQEGSIVYEVYMADALQLIDVVADVTGF